MERVIDRAVRSQYRPNFDIIKVSQISFVKKGIKDTH